ncbi:MAG: GGDEF domain-containing protein, partial [Salinibacter sp.]
KDVEDTPAAGTTEASETPHEEAPTLGPLLESLRSALDAQTVCLLVQEEIALTYRIEALASTHAAVRRDGTFDTQIPLLTATMSRETVTIRALAEEEIAVEDLGYYTSPPEVDHLAIAPIPRPNESSTTFLLADAPPGTDLGTSRARTLLEHFVDTIDLLRSDDSSAPDPSTSTKTDAHVDGNEQAPSDAQETATETEAPEPPRPRRELIAEEMEAAQTTEEDLALALVHLNRAESIARRGEEAVTSAEHLFQARLEQLLPGRRIERFGELTYGIFFRDGADAVEPQVAKLESMMAQEEGELEGGVSVGVAVWNEPDEAPEALRTEATEALREAYETGTPTIVT